MCVTYSEWHNIDHSRIAKAMIDNLRGTLSVRDVNGTLLTTEGLQPLPYFPMLAPIRLCPFLVPTTGVYQLTLNIGRGAAILSNIEHRIIVVYNPGGGDIPMAPGLWKYASIFSASFAGILLLACFLIWAKRAKSASQ
jgi:hypothetical protein